MKNEDSITKVTDTYQQNDCSEEQIETDTRDSEQKTEKIRISANRILAKILFKFSKYEKIFSTRRRKRFLSSAAKRDPVYKAAKRDPVYKDETVVSSEVNIFWFNADWYANKHGLAGAPEAIEHYQNFGISRCFSPDPSLVGSDGVSMDQWGVEYLFRLGAKIGELGKDYPENHEFDINDPFDIKNIEGKRLAVVTAIFGPFDRLRPIDSSWLVDADFYVFSDSWFENRKYWKSVNCNFDHPDPRRRARFVKTHLATYFSSYDWVIWVDGNVLICVNPRLVIEHLENENVNFAAFKHPERTNLVSEAAACVRFKKEDPEIVARHLRDSSVRTGFADELLFETMVCAAKPKDAEVRSMYARWWSGISRGSKRDQLSLPLAVLEHPDLAYGFIPYSINKSPWFAKTGHIDE